MVWTWRYEDASGAVVSPPGAPTAQPFASQSDAENWVGENWRDLLSAGVHQVTLLEGERTAYGPMGLHPD